ncbi:major facilitator superfamily domain-containing protein [Gloeopeniophorella convolvens]|nr:major facilitator superfamily domain-containing protein [Gloeopeniophorella convolvens]
MLSIGRPARKDAKPAQDEKTQPYPGKGTWDEPFVVSWQDGDPDNPYNWSFKRKWVIVAQQSLSTFTVSFASSAYSGGMAFMRKDIPMSETVSVIGISLYVLGFGLGPLLFASLSETFGRRPVFLCTMPAFTLFHLGGALGHNVESILIPRLFAGIFGASPLTNAGGVIADVFTPRDRGVATSIYATVPYLGPVVGPIAGGYISQSHLGWRFTFWLMFILSVISLVCGVLVMSETYAPVLLQRRAEALHKQSNDQKHYVTIYEKGGQRRKFKESLKINLTRPFRFIVTEPIVTLSAIYASITYATLYAQFSAYPIVFQQHRGFSAGQTGLAFLGIGVGVVSGTGLAPLQNRLYWRAMDRSETGQAPPEARLYVAILGGLLLPIGLFWFAWTTFPSVHPMVSIVSGVPTGIAIAVLLQSLTAYMMDTYNIYFASAIAATIVLRCVLAAAFPLFSPAMFSGLGDQWASSIFGFLAVGCAPVPMLFFKYGPWLRMSSPTFQVPNVFVHPPEEEQFNTRPWCAFDASGENVAYGMAFTSPEMNVLHSRLNTWSQTMYPTADRAPAFHRPHADSDIVLPRRGPFPHLQSDYQIPHRLSAIAESPKRPKERDDDDIIEVVKMRRGEGMPDVAYAHAVPAFKKSKTLRSRAAQALRSIKNVGKAPRQPAAEHIFPAPAKENIYGAETTGTARTRHSDDRPMKALPTQPSTPRLKKRASQPLSNIFGLGHGTSGSVSNSSQVTLPAKPERSRTLPYTRAASTSALHLPAEESARPASPSLSARGTRRKFSFVNLNGIFSGSTTAPSEPEPESEPQSAAPDAQMDDPAVPEAQPVSADDDGWDSEDYDSPRRRVDPGRRYRSIDESTLPEHEISFEMRLDSLHFDDLSFDADAF